MSLESYSQTDTVCVDRKLLIRALTRIESLKADSSELVLRKDEIKDLTVLTTQQRVSITTLQDKSSIQETRIANLQEQRDYSIRELKRVKARAVLFKVAGIGVTASLAFLLIAFK